LLERPDGVAFKNKDAPDCPFSSDSIAANLEALGYASTTKSLSFNKVKKRAYIIPFRMFVKVQQLRQCLNNRDCTGILLVTVIALGICLLKSLLFFRS